MNRSAFLILLSCLALSCTQNSGNTSGGDLVVINDTPWLCRLTVSIAGVETVIDAPAGETVTSTLGDCPANVVLVRQVFDPDGAAVETSFADWADNTLVKDENYACGDRIVVQVGAAGTTVYSEPAQ